MTLEAKIVDALRLVATKLQAAVEAGTRSRRIDAEDIIETLLAVAEEIDSANEGAR